MLRRECPVTASAAPGGRRADLVRALLFALLLSLLPLPAIAAPAPATLLTIDDAIGPATADYVVRGIARAAKDGSQIVILKMDTPGGLDTSMRSIIKAILASPVPVATWVAPSGARAASAGTYILYASHIAAMAPGTNLGAATPVQIGGPSEPAGDGKDRKSGKAASSDDATTSPMTRKQVNDAAAYIRGLAQLRGRNPDWAERAVREAVSLPADEALRMHVVDFIAPDIPALLAHVDGKTINAAGQDRQLHTRDAALIDLQPDWRAKLLATITHPGIALLLMTIGVYGLLFEFMSPGFGVPGVVGGICLLLALYALQLLPVNYAGLGLILLGLSFMIAEAFLPSFGIIGLGGVAAFIAGALMLIDTELPGYGIPLSLIVTVAVLSALLIVGMVGVVLKTRRRKIVSGPVEMIGDTAEVVDITQAGAPGEGWALLHGENWHVVSKMPLQRKQKVRVVARKGLLLEVVPLESH
ncbi:MAG TPA: nodulation protein NfeD [Noviherbaspirillum sp.]|uniref:NfeD family protein n=1 Tax=Noviherbaspirillum sp. TaxID=1926288 RepID=UPI002B46D96F|nr:nodulation protein NfeD [Noviherbaspirillum sp.]HJV88578.1 nodulation protein NfeD [Noviherbaspirillum sp.]